MTGKLLICLVLLAACCFAQPPGYSHGGTFTVDHTKVPNTDQTAFPVLITAQATAMKSVANGGQVQSSNAFDVLFSSDSGGTTLLPYQRLRHDLRLGRIAYYVQATLSHTADTSIYMWWANAAVATDQSNPTAVWDSNFKAVWHLNEAGASTVVADSTANAHNGTNAVQTASRITTGKLPNLTSLSFTTSLQDGIVVPSYMGSDFDFTSGDFTYSFWEKATTFGYNGAYFGNGRFQQGSGVYFQEISSLGAGFQFGVNGAALYSVSYAHKTSTWYHIAVARSGSTLVIYVNGAAIYTSGSFASPNSSSQPFHISGDALYDAHNAATMQEFRVSNAARSADWIATEFANENSPSTFFDSIPSGWDMTSTALPPMCNAGSPQSFRADFPGSLDGSGSSALTGSIAGYSWSQIQSSVAPLQSGLRLSSATAMQPSISGLVFGPLDMQLTVTQADGQASSCTVADGAVVADANGAAIISTGSGAFDAALKLLVGAPVKLGMNSWPFYDTAAQADAAIQIYNMDTAYFDFWNVPQAGTIAISPGSAAVAGTGTTFTTTFCQGPGSPTVPLASTGIVVWYPLNNAANQYGRRVVWPSSCADDTHITLGSVWSSLEPTCPTGQSAPCQLQYSIWNSNGLMGSLWTFSSAPANYYDVVTAYYALYYRSGLEVYLINARKLADRFWQSPENDLGNGYDAGMGFPWPPQFRCWSMGGMVLRALDTADGHPDMWGGLHKVWNYTMGAYWIGANFPGASILYPMMDSREWGDGLAQLAYCAMFDTSATYQQTCRTAIYNTFATSGTGYLNVWPSRLDSDGGWKQLFAGKASWSSTPASTVTLTYGSTTVACATSNCGWVSGDFAATSPQAPVWFIASSVRPTSNSQGDPDTYCYTPGSSATCTFIDANNFTLDRPYDGANCASGCTRGWVFASQGAVGWGQEPFFTGILAWAFDLAGRAMACVSTNTPVSCDTPTSTLAYQYNTSAVQWLMANGYWAGANGFYYYSTYPGCTPPSGNNIVCTQNYSNIAARELFGDAFRGMLAYYVRTGDAAAKTMIDKVYAGLWGKPGTNPIVASPDSTYDTSFDTGGYWMMAGATQNKLFGQMFGFSRQDNWPVARVGGPLAQVTVAVGVRLADVAGATQISVTYVEPSGAVSNPQICSSSPCVVTVSNAANRLQIAYLSASGQTLASGQTFPLAI